MKLHSIEPIEHLVEIELSDGTMWPIYAVHEDILEKLGATETAVPEKSKSKETPTFI